MLSRTMSSSMAALRGAARPRGLARTGALDRVAATPRCLDRRHRVSVTSQGSARTELMSHLRRAEIQGWSKDEIQTYSWADFVSRDEGLKAIGKDNKLMPDVDEIYYNSPTGILYQRAIAHEPGSCIVSSGALAVRSGVKTGHGRVVLEEDSNDDVWGGKVDMLLPEDAFLTSRERARRAVRARRLRRLGQAL